MAQCLSKFWGDKKRALWYVMAFSGVVNSPFRNEAETGSSSLSQRLLGRLLGTVEKLANS